MIILHKKYKISRKETLKHYFQRIEACQYCGVSTFQSDICDVCWIKIEDLNYQESIKF